MRSAIAFSNALMVAASMVPVGSTPSFVWTRLHRIRQRLRPDAVHRTVPEADDLQGLLDGRRHGHGFLGGVTVDASSSACSASAVALSTVPVTGSPCAVCRFSTAATVAGPETPSTGPQ